MENVLKENPADYVKKVKQTRSNHLLFSLEKLRGIS